MELVPPSAPPAAAAAAAALEQQQQQDGSSNNSKMAATGPDVFPIRKQQLTEITSFPPLGAITSSITNQNSLPVYGREVVGRRIEEAHVGQQTGSVDSSCSSVLQGQQLHDASVQQAWGSAEIADFNPETGMHKLRYLACARPDEWLCLPALRFCFTGSAFDPQGQQQLAPNPSSEGSPVALEAVGRKLRIYWPAMGKWFAAQVKGYDAASDTHRIVYKDGDVQDVHLRNEAVRWLDSSEPLSPTASDGGPRQLLLLGGPCGTAPAAAAAAAEGGIALCSAAPLPAAGYPAAHRRPQPSSSGDALVSSQPLQAGSPESGSGTNTERGMDIAQLDVTETASPEMSSVAEDVCGQMVQSYRAHRPMACIVLAGRSSGQLAAPGSGASSPLDMNWEPEHEQPCSGTARSATENVLCAPACNRGNRGVARKRSTTPVLPPLSIHQGLSSGSAEAADMQPAAAKRQRRVSNGQRALCAPGAELQEVGAEAGAQLLVGARIGVFWDGDDTFYRGKIVSCGGTFGRCRVSYDDGESEWLQLANERVRWYTPRGHSSGYGAALHTVLVRLGMEGVAQELKVAGEVPYGAGLESGTLLEAGYAPVSTQGAVGRRVHIFWQGDGSWCPAEVLAFNAKTGRHHVLWSSGEDEWLDLGQEALVWARAGATRNGGGGCTTPTAVGVIEGEPAPQGRAAIGWRVSVYWPKEMAFYSGRITAYDNATGRHTVLYDDGDSRLLSLHGHKVVWRLPAGLGDAEEEEREPKETIAKKGRGRRGRPPGSGSAGGSSSREPSASRRNSCEPLADEPAVERRGRGRPPSTAQSLDFARQLQQQPALPGTYVVAPDVQGQQVMHGSGVMAIAPVSVVARAPGLPGMAGRPPLPPSQPSSATHQHVLQRRPSLQQLTPMSQTGSLAYAVGSPYATSNIFSTEQAVHASQQQPAAVPPAGAPAVAAAATSMPSAGAAVGRHFPAASEAAAATAMSGPVGEPSAEQWVMHQLRRRLHILDLMAARVTAAEAAAAAAPPPSALVRPDAQMPAGPSSPPAHAHSPIPTPSSASGAMLPPPAPSAAGTHAVAMPGQQMVLPTMTARKSVGVLSPRGGMPPAPLPGPSPDELLRRHQGPPAVSPGPAPMSAGLPSPSGCKLPPMAGMASTAMPPPPARLPSVR